MIVIKMPHECVLFCAWYGQVIGSRNEWMKERWKEKGIYEWMNWMRL